MDMHLAAYILFWMSTSLIPIQGIGYYPYLHDLILHGDDYATTDGFYVDGGITMGKQKYHKVYTSTNGIITFGMYSRSYTPIRIQATSSYPPLIAAWWTDIYPNVGGSNFYYKAYTSGSILQRAANDILRFSNRTSFSPTWMMVATWHNSPLYCCQREERVTVQAVLVTDSVSTYVMFNYIDVNIPVKRHNIAIGWFNNVTSYSHSLSFTNSAYSMSKQAGNRGKDGFLFYDISDDVNECKEYSGICNHGTCTNTYGSYYCTCHTGFEGTNCRKDINECGSGMHSPCYNGGTCINTIGSFTCTCNNGWTGPTCEIDIDECVSLDPCLHCGQCLNIPGSFKCSCQGGYTGPTCQHDIDECSTFTCNNGGTCMNRDGDYYCSCPPGLHGDDCNTITDLCNEGSCMNNASCTTSTASVFSCNCSGNWTGQFCHEALSSCSSSPCLNNGTCVVANNDEYICDCYQGYTGKNCETELDPCVSSPCSENTTCVNRNGTYHCLCPSGFSGINCLDDIDECTANNYCEHGGICVNTVGSFYCVCLEEWEGDNCQQDVDECLRNPCSENATCINYNGTYSCQCMEGYRGVNCSEQNNCSGNMTCNNGGECITDGGLQICNCSLHWEGPTCDEDVDECLSTPCVYGKCYNLLGSFYCECSIGYEGQLCQTDVDECQYSPCINNGTCTNTAGGYMCNCPSEFNGKHCASGVKKCSSNPCTNGGTCTEEDLGYTCNCLAGFNGTNCETDIDECMMSPCMQNATCQNILGSFHCNCGNGRRGLLCDEDVDECRSSPCENNGFCQNTYGSYVCHCSSGYTDRNCQTDIDECLSSPCYNGSSCINTNGTFKCCCQEGRTGKLCNEDFNECTLFPCINNGTCHNTKDGYNCTCTRFFTSKNCEEDVNECLTDPCQNNATCENFYGGFKCHCITGTEGTYCDGDIDECLSFPCKNGATCINTPGSFICNCVENYGGFLCGTDLCATSPAEIVFLVDSSTSVSYQYFNKQLDYITQIVKRINISTEKFQVAVISYANEAYIDIPFNSNFSKSDLLSEIQNITYRNGTTNIYAACEAVQDILEVKDNSAQYVYLLTDGMPTDLSMAGEGISILRQYLSNSSSFNEVFIIAFGEDVRHEGLRKLSVDPYFYSDIYDPINMDPYYKMIKRLISPHCSACTATLTDRADVVILIDKSTQFDQQLYNQQLNAVMNTTRLLNTMVIGRENIQVGAVAFSNAVSHIMWLNETQDIITLNRRIGSLQQDKVNTSSRRGEALEYVRTKYLDIAKGAREDNIRKFVIHFDCGFDEDTSKTRKEIEALMNRTNVIVVSVGVGPHFVEDTLLSSASSPFYSFFSDVLLPDEDLLIMFKNTRYISCTSRIRS